MEIPVEPVQVPSFLKLNIGSDFQVEIPDGFSQATLVKILYWDQNGFCLWHKKLEKHIFLWPDSKEQVKTIGKRELSWLLDGIDLNQKQAHKPLNYSVIF